MNISAQYFDWAASTPQNPEIAAEALEIAQKYAANPSSVHRAGLEAREKLEEARKRCADVLQVKPECLVFTSGGTESNHIPLLSLLQKPVKGSIVISAIEHAAVREQALALERCGRRIIIAGCGKDGIVSADEVLKKCADDTELVCIMAVNNETGAIQPIYQIADALGTLKGRRPKLHVDAVQAAGKIPFDFSYPGINSAAISAHKIYGARGIGLLYTASRTESFLKGGGQEGGTRSGTENLFGIWSLMRCLETCAEKTVCTAAFKAQKEKTAFFIDALQKIPGCTIIPEVRAARPDLYSPWIVQASFKGIPGEVAVRALSERGFYISTGSACSARKNKRPVLSAMKIAENTARSSVRFSFGSMQRQKDIEALIEAVREVNTLFGQKT